MPVHGWAAADDPFRLRVVRREAFGTQRNRDAVDPTCARTSRATSPPTSANC